MKQSKHCSVRNQQRCIPPIVHDWLSTYGVKSFDGHGGIKVYFAHKSIKKMEKDFGSNFVSQIKKYLNVYRDESAKDGTAITTGWRNKRIKTN